MSLCTLCTLGALLSLLGTLDRIAYLRGDETARNLLAPSCV